MSTSIASIIDQKKYSIRVVERKSKTHIIADEVFRRLNLGEENYKDYAVIGSLVKRFGESRIMAALQYLQDYPNAKNKVGLLIWYLNKKRGNND